jgi:hypothetical protein
MTATQKSESPRVNRMSIVRHLQRKLVPFLATDSVDQRLAEVEATGILGDCDSGRSKTFELESTLNACLFRHSAFFEPREARSLQQELLFWQQFTGLESPEQSTRYRIEQSIKLADRDLPEDGLLQLWVPVPRAIVGIQRVKLLSAEPAGLAEYYLPTAGQIYGAPLLVEPGTAMPELRLVFEVEQTASSLLGVPDYKLFPETTDRIETAAVAAWVKERALERLDTESTQAFIDSVVDRMEIDLCFALSAGNSSPIRTLLQTGAGDVAMQTRLLAAVLSLCGVAVRLGVGQRLMLVDGRSRLWYPRSTGYEHIFLEWHDTDRAEQGCVDLSYLERWCYVTTERNTLSEATRAEFQQVGQRARAWLRRNRYPIDLILAGSAPQCRIQSFSSNETYRLHAPVDVELEASRLQ